MSKLSDSLDENVGKYCLSAEVNNPLNLTKPNGLGKRHLHALLCFIGFFVAFGLRSNLSVAIVAMTNTNSTSNTNFEKFTWNEYERGLILSSLYWGYVISPIFAGILAKIYGPKYTLFLAILLISILTIFTSYISSYGWKWMCASRFLQGIGQGFCYPCVHTLLAKWIHPIERSLISITYSGCILGTAFMLSISGYIASSKILGWPGIFYISGGMGIFWSILWLIFCSNTPHECKTITKNERDFIESMPGGNRSTKISIPWKRILLSKPFWAILITQATENWLFVTLLTNIPSYIDGVLQYSLESNSLLSALPYLVMTIMIFLFSYLSDYLISHKCITTTNARRTFNTIAMWCPAICLIILGNINNNIYSAILLLTVCVGFNAGINSGYIMNHVDISPNFAGPIMGVCHGIGNILSVVGPMFVGSIVYDIHKSELWNIVFQTTAGISFFGGLMFLLWASGDVQSWNDTKTGNLNIRKP